MLFRPKWEPELDFAPPPLGLNFRQILVSDDVSLLKLRNELKKTRLIEVSELKYHSFIITKYHKLVRLYNIGCSYGDY